ncbi:Hypothetical_protein [Hexamita inflata]|uniref:Hypothetical_protein n=1 Tax=Hexamita inflata TaxID=28002 RepID=A0AA86NQP5_9EUKA|nr:Hypothetical protein HINF_LOCUS11319 [Hexamita inflata]
MHMRPSPVLSIILSSCDFALGQRIQFIIFHQLYCSKIVRVASSKTKRTVTSFILLLHIVEDIYYLNLKYIIYLTKLAQLPYSTKGCYQQKDLQNKLHQPEKANGESVRTRDIWLERNVVVFLLIIVQKGKCDHQRKG